MAESFFEWFQDHYSSLLNKQDRPEESCILDSKIDITIKAFLGNFYFLQIREGLFGDLISFYGVASWIMLDDEKTMEDSLVRIFVNTERRFMFLDKCLFKTSYLSNHVEEYDTQHMAHSINAQLKEKDANTIRILQNILPLSDDKHIKNVKKAIKKYSKKISDSKDMDSYRLKRLQRAFDAVESFNENAQHLNKNNDVKRYINNEDWGHRES